MTKTQGKIAILVAIIGAVATIGAATIMRDWWNHKPEKVTGRVIDAVSGQRIHNAKVSLEGVGLPDFVYTDKEGIFSFPLTTTKDPRIVVEVDKYQKYDRRISISPNSELEDIRLEPLESKQKIVTVSVANGDTANLFDNELTIHLIRITKVKGSSDYEVTAVIDSPGCEALRFQNRGDNHKEAYKCKENFDIEILKINKSFASFKVFRQS